MEDFYVMNADPDDDNYQDAGIESSLAGNITVAPDLGIFRGAFQRQLIYYQSLSMHSSVTMVYGASKMPAIVANNGDAAALGERSVVAFHRSQTSFSVGTNGVFSVLNVVTDAYGPG